MGQIQETKDNIAMLKAAGVPDAKISGYGGRLSNSEAQSILSAFKASGSPYSSANIASSVTAPATRPDYNDSLALRDSYFNELGVPQAQADIQKLTQQLNAFDTSTQQSLDAIENQPLRMGVITGEQAATARSAATSREAIAKELAAKTSFLDAARTEANTRLSLKQQDLQPVRDLMLKTGGNAGITIYDSVETAAKKASSYQAKLDEETRQQDEKDFYTKLYVSTFGAPPKKGASLKDMQKKLEKQAKKDKDTKRRLEDIEYALKKKELSKPYYKEGTAEAVDTTDKGLASFIEQGVNAGDDWATVAATIAQTIGPNAIKSGSFADKYLRYKFLNEENPLQ